VLSRLQHKQLKKNAVVLQAGEVCRNIYFVNKGCLRVFNTDEAGNDHNNLFCPENWWAADLASFSNQAPAFYAVSALEDSDLFYLNFNALERLYLEVPKLERPGDDAKWLQLIPAAHHVQPFQHGRGTFRIVQETISQTGATDNPKAYRFLFGYYAGVFEYDQEQECLKP
jgi:hypothetical protein